MKPWYAPRKPGDPVPAYPWLHPEAVEYLEGLLTPEMRVLEHGAGGSTLWFAERVKEVVTLEHNPEWAEKMRALAPANVRVIHTGTQEARVTCPFDLFLIDGAREQRGQMILLSPQLVKPGGWVVLDNANRPEYAMERHGLEVRARPVARFENNIPGSKYFVTEFWKVNDAGGL